jgi:hypothetical protein
MGDGGGDIIIKGGSCDLIYSEDMYPAEKGDPSRHKNKNNQKVTQVIITGDIEWDSQAHPSGLTCEIKVIVK